MYILTESEYPVLQGHKCFKHAQKVGVGTL